MSVAVTVYDVMALPPLLLGAVKETEAEAFPATALTAVGAFETVGGAGGGGGVDVETLP